MFYFLYYKIKTIQIYNLEWLFITIFHSVFLKNFHILKNYQCFLIFVAYLIIKFLLFVYTSSIL